MSGNVPGKLAGGAMESCALEPEVLAAADGGPLPESLRSHVAVCAQCREAMMLRSFLDHEAEGDPQPAGLIYWKAQLRARREQAEKAMRPAALAEFLLVPVLLAVVLALLPAAGSPALIAAMVTFVLLVAAVGGFLYARLRPSNRRL